MVEYYPSYLVFREFTRRHMHVCVCGEGTELIFEVHSRSRSLIDWDVMDHYLRRAVPLIRGWSPMEKPPKAVRVKVYEDYTPKRLPPKGSPLTPDNINSGLTYLHGDTDGTKIEIFRMEEFPKVLCHELLHVFGVAIPLHAELVLSAKAAEIFGVQHLHTLRINEALTELNATVLNAAILSSGSLSNRLAEEYRHSADTIARMRAHFDLPPGSWGKWAESTHAFSYMVLKHLFMGEVLGSKDAFNRVQKGGGRRFTMTKTALNFKKLT